MCLTTREHISIKLIIDTTLIIDTQYQLQRSFTGLPGEIFMITNQNLKIGLIIRTEVMSYEKLEC